MASLVSFGFHWGWFGLVWVERKLYCSRNTLHMHLFISFIMRAFMALLKDNLFVDGVDLVSPNKFVDPHSYQSSVSVIPAPSFRSISFHFVPFRSISFHFVPFRVISGHFGSFRAIHFFLSLCLGRVESSAVGVQGGDQLLAVLHHGQLLVDLHGGPLPAQPDLHGAVHRQQRHHHLHLPRMG